MEADEAETAFRMGDRSVALSNAICDSAECEWCAWQADEIEDVMWVVVDHVGAAYYCTEHVPNQWGAEKVFAARRGRPPVKGRDLALEAEHASLQRWVDGKEMDARMAERQQAVLRRFRKKKDGKEEEAEV